VFVSQEGDLGNNTVSLESKLFITIYILDLDMVAVDERKAIFYL
jgi:hypothetical protein